MASAMPDWVAAEVMGHEVTTARRHYVRSTLEQRMEATRAVETLARG